MPIVAISIELVSGVVRSYRSQGVADCLARHLEVFKITCFRKFAFAYDDEMLYSKKGSSEDDSPVWIHCPRGS
jgi:hypothetical protein